MKTILAPTGLSVNSYNPKFGVMKNHFIEDLTDKITGLSFEKLAMGGDWRFLYEQGQRLLVPCAAI